MVDAMFIEPELLKTITSCLSILGSTLGIYKFARSLKKFEVSVSLT